MRDEGTVSHGESKEINLVGARESYRCASALILSSRTAPQGGTVAVVDGHDWITLLAYFKLAIEILENQEEGPAMRDLPLDVINDVLFFEKETIRLSEIARIAPSTTTHEKWPFTVTMKNGGQFNITEPYYHTIQRALRGAL